MLKKYILLLKYRTVDSHYNDPIRTNIFGPLYKIIGIHSKYMKYKITDQSTSTKYKSGVIRLINKTKYLVPA